MFLELLKFEIKGRLGRLSATVYFCVFLAVSFLMAISFGGAFKGVTMSFGLSNKLALNSPVVLNYIISFGAYLGLLITAPIFGQSINQDFETKFQQVLFATPIRKFDYFFVRYLGSFISSICILSSIAIGIWIATFMPFLDRTLVAENHLWFYIAPYLTNVIPNTLVFGAIFIAVVSLFKKMAPVYVASIAVFTGWMISQNLTSDLDNKFVAALIEPFGLEGVSQIIRYWSVAEQNTRVVPITGNFLYNRLLWGAIGLGFLAFAYFSFDPFKQGKEKKTQAVESSTPTFKFFELRDLGSQLLPDSWKVFWQLSLSEFRQAFSNIYFLIILLCGILYIFGISSQVGKIFGTETLPVTYHVLELVGGSFSLFIVILVAYYAGELIWKDRDQNVYELIDSKPVSNLFLYLSKLLSLVIIQFFLSALIMVCCILIQIFKGYYHFEFPVYFKTLFFYSLVGRLLVSVFALFVQTMSRNKYIGHSIVIFYYIAMMWLPSLGFDHHLYLLDMLPRSDYSDMNGYGTSLYPFTVFTIYWGFFHLFLAVLTVLFWRRGVISTWKDRFKEFETRIQPIHRRLIYGSLASWILVGGFIFYNTNILNTYKPETDVEREQVDYEREYRQFKGVPQPEIISASIQTDIFPETQTMLGRGRLKYKNKTSSPIKTVMLNISETADIGKIEWERPATLTKTDKRLGVRIYDFADPLKPGEETALGFEVDIKPHGFQNSEFEKKIIGNGTFFYNSDFSPLIGYISDRELHENKSRRKYELSPRLRMPDLNDVDADKKTYISSEGTWIDFDATVSTSEDQTAIAPGYLEKEWHENGRHYFHYKMDKPILDFYAVLSARYEVVRDKWSSPSGDVNIEVYYHPGHDTDVARMINSVKKSLDYFTKNFSPYQFRQVRIMEFPRYERFAQSFPNTIPFSEAIGFIARVKPNDPEEIDYPFYITAHEVAHQWWAHQVIGGNVQGSTMLSESLAQYSSLMVQEKEYGPDQMKKFLKYELDRYLMGRSRETERELPLVLNEDQGYIHYEKGSLVFYALKDYLGEDVVNKVLHDYIHDVAFQQAPFTRAVDLVKRFKAVTPDDKKYLIEDLFETITFYDNRTDTATYHKLPSGKFTVDITSTNKKVRTDGLGRETEVPMNDYLDVGVFDDKGKLLYLEKQKAKSGQNVFHVEVDRQPAKAGVDPLNKLIDKVSDDNVVRVTEAK